LQFVIYFLPFKGKTAQKGGEMPNPTLAQRNAPRAPKLLDRVRETMRMSRYSPRTQAAYVCHARPDLNYCHHQGVLKALIRA
jgi:hypothetical protein